MRLYSVQPKDSQNFQELHHRIMQKRLQMGITKKYLKKDTYLQKKDGKLLVI